MPTLKAKLRENRRRKRLRLLRRLVILVVLASGLIYVWRYVHQPGFAYGAVQITGSSLLTEQDIIRMAGSQEPFNLFDVSAGDVQYALKHDIRFADAKVEYKWPGVLCVTVSERVPAIYIASAYRSYAKVDFTGTVLGVTTAIPDADAPLLIGEDCGNMYIGDQINNENVLNILFFLENIGQEANDQIVEITVDNKQNVKILLKAGFPVLLGKTETIKEKVNLFNTVFNEIKNKNIQADYIDLTYSKPYVGLKSNNEVKNEIPAKT